MDVDVGVGGVGIASEALTAAHPRQITTTIFLLALLIAGSRCTPFTAYDGAG